MLKVNFDLNSSERSIGSRVSVFDSTFGLGDGWEVADVDWATEGRAHQHKIRMRRIGRVPASNTVKDDPSRRDRMFIDCRLKMLSKLRRSVMHRPLDLSVNSPISLLQSCVVSLTS